MVFFCETTISPPNSVQNLDAFHCHSGEVCCYETSELKHRSAKDIRTTGKSPNRSLNRNQHSMRACCSGPVSFDVRQLKVLCIFASSPCHFYGVSSIFCSGFALYALAFSRSFLLLYAGSWRAGFRPCIIHGLRGMCVFSAPLPNPAVKRVAPYFRR